MITSIRDEIKLEFPLYKNFIDNYFLKNKLKYFKDNSLYYKNIPKDCRTNNYFENYNGYIKRQLGKSRIINWINFIDFIKKESQRSIEKLMHPQSIRILSINNINNPN